METVYGILLAVVLAVVIMVFSSKKRKESWSGVVSNIKKKVITRDDEGYIEDEYIVVHYKTDNGKKGKFSLRKSYFDKMYPNLKIGDRLIKNAGEEYPKVA